MNRIHYFFSIALLFLLVSCAQRKVSSSAAAEIKLSQDGKALCPIVLPDNATVVQQTAAKELQEHLNLITGGSFEIKKASEVVKNAPQIIIGPFWDQENALPELRADGFAYDEILIKTVGNKLILSGHEQRGMLYAVNTFLEDYAGVRWWTSSERFIPQKPTLEIPKIDVRYAPKLIYREAYYLDAYDHVFATRMKCNGHFAKITPDYGNHHQIIGWCHTFSHLLPRATYFSEHPEWYSEVDGKRTNDFHGQLCLTNEEMKKEFIRNTKETIRRNPEAIFISVSQNDTDAGNCQCEKCRAVDAEEGSPSGLLLRFVNDVAEEVEKEFPNMWVETLAYQYTRKPPKVTKPRKNVIVRLCTIECSFAQPLTGEQNKTLRDDIEGWNKIAPQLFVWDYVTNFHNYIIPHPNLFVLAPNIRFFVKNGTIGLFEQGDSYCNIGDFVGLRNYVISHLLWNPNQNEQQLIREFMNGYYGAAAPVLMDYLKLIHEKAASSGAYIGCYRQDISEWFTLKDFNQATLLFGQALDAVKNDAVLSERVRKAKMPLDQAWLLQYHDLQREAKATGTPFRGPADGKAACQEFFDLCRQWKTASFREFNAVSIADHEKDLMKRFDDAEMPETQHD